MPFRPVIIVLAVFAIGIAGLAAYLVSAFLESQSAPAAVAQPETPPALVGLKEVLVASRDIPAGVVLQQGDLRFESWPESLLDPRFAVKGAEDPAVKFVGAVSKRSIMKGEPLAAEAVFRQDEAGLLAGMLAPGMRAVSVPVTVTTGASGFILPGDRVDVITASELKFHNEEDRRKVSDTVSRYVSETILRDVRVLAIDQILDAPAGGGGPPAMTAKSATLEVTPKQAEILATGALMGQLSLVLRSVAENLAGEPEGASFTTDVDSSLLLKTLGQRGAAASAAESFEIRMNKGGVTEVLSFMGGGQ